MGYPARPGQDCVEKAFPVGVLQRHPRDPAASAGSGADAPVIVIEKCDEYQHQAGSWKLAPKIINGDDYKQI